MGHCWQFSRIIAALGIKYVLCPQLTVITANSLPSSGSLVWRYLANIRKQRGESDTGRHSQTQANKL